MEQPRVTTRPTPSVSAAWLWRIQAGMVPTARAWVECRRKSRRLMVVRGSMQEKVAEDYVPAPAPPVSSATACGCADTVKTLG